MFFRLQIDGRVWCSERRAYVATSDAAFAAWSAEYGAATAVADEPALIQTIEARHPLYVPPSVPLWKARAELRRLNLLAAVNAAVAASGSIPMQEAFEYSMELHRANTALVQLAGALGLSAAALDQLFRDAHKIEA